MNADTLLSRDGIQISGPLLFKPRIFNDDRGYFYESWNESSFRTNLQQNGQSYESFVQDNHSSSRRGVIRGLHYQSNPDPQAKLVRCVVGEIFDVAVDIRKRSPTYGMYVGAKLSSSNHEQLWIPQGFAHGFMALTEEVVVLYKTTSFWNPSCEGTLRWDDPDLNICWPLDSVQGEIILSEKDRSGSLFGDIS